MKITSFEKHFENVHNTSKQAKLDDHQNKVQYFNANKSKVENIVLKPEDKWEEEARKIIDGNVYLNNYWNITKIQQQQKQIEEKLKNAELSQDEKRDMQTKIQELNKKISEEERQIQDKINKDLAEINAL